MSRIASNLTLHACGAALICGALGLTFTASVLGAERGRGQAQAAPALDYSVTKDGVPNLASIDFAWLSDGADWMDPPQGTIGHGKISADPAHPLINNVEAIRRGVTP